MYPERFCILGLVFKTKSALQKKIREILYAYHNNCALNMIDFLFMCEVFKYHPDYKIKCGIGISSIQIRQNTVYKNTQCFWIVRKDESETDISFLECLHETSQERRFFRACRVAVEQDTENFKRTFFRIHGNSSKCPYTGEIIKFRTAHVDHKAPNTFKKIVGDFLEEYNICIKNIVLNARAQDGECQDRIEDKGLERQWIDYHKCHAVLQIVSRLANLSILKGKVEIPEGYVQGELF